VIEAKGCEQLAQDCYVAVPARPRSFDRKSEAHAITITPRTTLTNRSYGELLKSRTLERLTYLDANKRIYDFSVLYSFIPSYQWIIWNLACLQIIPSRDCRYLAHRTDFADSLFFKISFRRFSFFISIFITDARQTRLATRTFFRRTLLNISISYWHLSDYFTVNTWRC